MTLSDEARLQAVNAALSGMLFELGDRTFISVRFEIRSDRFRDLPQTTWLELESSGYVERMHAMGNPGFKLTGQGWVAALKAARVYDTPEVHARAIALRAALKGAVKGRPLYGARTNLSSLHSATAVPANWIANALCSRLLQHLWPDEHLDLDLEHGLRGIRVPARFGSKRLFGLVAGPAPFTWTKGPEKLQRIIEATKAAHQNGQLPKRRQKRARRRPANNIKN